MASFFLAADLNLGIGRWLRGRGHKVARFGDGAGSDDASDPPLTATPGDQILLTHDERLRPEDMGSSDSQTILIVPQPSLDDIARVAEAVHQLVIAGRASPGARLRLGLRSGWQPLS